MRFSKTFSSKNTNTLLIIFRIMCKKFADSVNNTKYFNYLKNNTLNAKIIFKTFSKHVF
ncbi:hypothetical protein EV145_11378 [Flavobacterium sp. 245]|nr:hypothetical protein EV145_11378 [Flavobacterium sp. 245]